MLTGCDRPSDSRARPATQSESEPATESQCSEGVFGLRALDALYALEDNCSHADTPLSEGRLRRYALTCPLHGTSFDVRTGEHSGPPAYTGVACFRVEDRDGTAVAISSADGDDDDSDGFGNVGGMFRTR